MNIEFFYMPYGSVVSCMSDFGGTKKKLFFTVARIT